MSDLFDDTPLPGNEWGFSALDLELGRLNDLVEKAEDATQVARENAEWCLWNGSEGDGDLRHANRQLIQAVHVEALAEDAYWAVDRQRIARGSR